MGGPHQLRLIKLLLNRNLSAPVSRRSSVHRSRARRLRPVLETDSLLGMLLVLSLTITSSRCGFFYVNERSTKISFCPALCKVLQAISEGFFYLPLRQGKEP